MGKQHWVLLAPIMSEKATRLGDRHNVHAFWISLKAKKSDVRQACEELFGVKVSSVNTLRVRPELRVRGRHKRLGSWRKKAYITLAPGESMSLAGEHDGHH